MNPEMKKDYKTFINANDLQATYLHCLGLMKEWEAQKADVQMGSAGVNPKEMHRMHRLTNEVFCEPCRVEVNPVLPNNMCHQNAIFLELKYGWKRVYGYNITACCCGGLYSMEIHSLNRDDDGHLVDWTRDFNGEKMKWFVELKDQSKPSSLISKVFNHNFDHFRWGCDRCKCSVNWDFEKWEKGEVANYKELVEEVKTFTKIKVITAQDGTYY